MPTSKSVELAKECRRLEESALYTSTALFIWLRFLRGVRVFFTAAPLVLGSLASWRVLRGPDHEVLAAVLAFLAGLFPVVYRGLKIDRHLAQCQHAAAEFKNLQHRFRQAAFVSSLKSFAAFEADVEPLIRRLERACQPSITTPEWCFNRARRKIRAGDYTFDVDETAIAHADSATAI